MPIHLSRRTISIMIVYFPLLIGTIFTSLGIAYYLEISRTYAEVAIPEYGVLPFSSTEFMVNTMRVEIKEINLDEGYAYCSTTMSGEVKNVEGEIMFGLQVPYNVQEASFKVGGYNDDKTELFYQGEATTQYGSGDATILYYVFKPESKNPSFTVEVDFKWLNTISRSGYTEYELLVPMSIGDSTFLGTEKPNVFTIEGDVPVSVMIDLPAGARVVESMPPAVGEITSIRESAAYRYLMLENMVSFGNPHGYPISESFRVAFNIQSLSERRDTLVFDSGLFLGVGIQFLIAGLYDAIRLREKSDGQFAA